MSYFGSFWSPCSTPSERDVWKYLKLSKLQKDIATNINKSKSNFIIANDVEIEGYYVFDDGTELDWISNLYYGYMNGASDDGIVLGTQNSYYAGSWADSGITDNQPYICEKNDQ